LCVPQLAAESGLQFKPLTASAVEKHMSDFGIDPEDASHTLIRSLSGGQKIKVVLAAATWQNPHVIVLDEPTNYLDRDSLGALVMAIQEYKGGVIIISHNREFAQAVCQEKWIMDAGRLRREGESVALHEEVEQAEELGERVVQDAMGNDITVKKQVQMSDKDKKKEIKRLQKAIKDGKKRGMREEEMADLELKLEELQLNP
jgi:elongation factor 3